MKRDMDYVRSLLLDIESKNRPSMGQLLPAGAGKDEHTKLAEHLRMLIDDAGLVAGIATPNLEGKYWLDLHLSWGGHDFLDSIRDDDVWAKTKSGALAAGGWTLDILKDLAKGLIKKQIEERTGVKL